MAITIRLGSGILARVDRDAGEEYRSRNNWLTKALLKGLRQDPSEATTSISDLLEAVADRQHVRLRVPAPLLEGVNMAAQAAGVSRSDWMRGAILARLGGQAFSGPE